MTDSKSRLVVFAGPHKSASSSIQEFFIRHASSPHNDTGKWINNHHLSLTNWTWPYIVRRRSYQSRKGFAPLVTEYKDPGWEKAIHETILSVWKTAESKQLILGTEELDRFGKTPWSGRDGLSAIEKLVALLQPDSVDIVVNYRRPRSHQWISIWKQLTRKEKETPAYSEYLCRDNAYDMLWEYLDCVSNPIGLANALLERFGGNATVHLLDMEGINKKDLDISHVFACRILQDVPCTNEWVDGMPHPEKLNQKFGNPGITQRQIDEMEWMFLQRDCSYYEDKSLLQNPNLKVHYGSTMLKECSAPRIDIPRWVFTNATVLLKFLQGQVGCGGLSSVRDMIEEMQKAHAPTRKPKKIRAVPKSAVPPSTAMTQSRKAPAKMQTDEGTFSELTHQDVLGIQLCALLLAVVIFICLMLRQLKFKRHTQRRWAQH